MGGAGLALSGCRTFKEGRHFLGLGSVDRAKSTPTPATRATWKGAARPPVLLLGAVPSGAIVESEPGGARHTPGPPGDGPVGKRPREGSRRMSPLSRLWGLEEHTQEQGRRGR